MSNLSFILPNEFDGKNYFSNININDFNELCMKAVTSLFHSYQLSFR